MVCYALLLLPTVAAAGPDDRTGPWAPGYAPRRTDLREPPPTVGQWEGREDEAVYLVKNYEPPSGAGTINERMEAYLDALGPGDAEAALPWRGEQVKGPLYKVTREVSTAQGWRTFAFKARLDRDAVEPASKAAAILFKFETPEALRFPGKVFVKAASTEATACPRTPEDIEAVAAGHHEEMTTLYKDHVANKPALRGRVAVRFTVRVDGTVSDAAAIRSSTEDVEFDAAIAAAVAGWTFPPVEGDDVVVVYPFAFSAQKR